MSFKKTNRMVALAVSAALTGCALTPTYQRPDVVVPASWTVDGSGSASADAAATKVSADWWTRYGSEELDQLMARALATNHEIGAARQRIEQSRAALRVARAQRLPAATLGGSAQRSRVHEADVDSHSEQGSLTVSYEADLWGGQAANASGARSRLLATQADTDALALVIQSEVATNYFSAIALRERIGIAEQNQKLAEELLRLVNVRNDNGATGALEVAQQRTVLLGIQAQIPQLQQQLSATLSALAVLIGEAPQTFTIAAQSLAALSIPAIAADPPASLMEQRPDVRAVEASLHAANADVGAARSALFPSLSLSAGATVAGIASGGTSTVASLAASVAQVLFDGGERRAQVAGARAAYGELAENYAQTVLTAYQEVHDSLTDVKTAQRRVDLLASLVEQSDRAYQLARIRYDNGADDLLTLLDGQRTRLDAQDSLVQAQVARYTSTTALFKALGGGWSGS
jgi:NodT family efflux transporter outer membrane factor (OMF) lipoprotein